MTDRIEELDIRATALIFRLAANRRVDVVHELLDDMLALLELLDDMLALLKQQQAALSAKERKCDERYLALLRLEEENARLRTAIEKAPCRFATGLECSSLTGPPYCLPPTKDVGEPYVRCWKRQALKGEDKP